MSTKTITVDQLNCREYLVDGKLKKWEGDTSEVYSTISSDPNKPYAQTLLGSIPDMDSESALEALESAKKAFNRGAIKRTPCFAGLKIVVLPIRIAGINKQKVSLSG